MWIDDIPDGQGWTALWRGKILCGDCNAIRSAVAPCPACDRPPYDCEMQTFYIDGKEVRVVPAFMGAEGRYEDYVLLCMMEREWNRPPQIGREICIDIPERAAIVLLFWTYFETRIERLLKVGLAGVSDSLVDDTLKRYSSVDGRLTKLYKVLFRTTYRQDLFEAGYPLMMEHLSEVQERRNRFIHGNPSALDEPFLMEVVSRISDEHESWIAVFNKRIRALREGQVR